MFSQCKGGIEFAAGDAPQVEERIRQAFGSQCSGSD
jgi:hypothetical protein